MSRPDLIKKVPGNCNFGNYSYVVIEAKLGAHIQNHYIIQALANNDLLAKELGEVPKYFLLYLGKSKFERIETRNHWERYLYLLNDYKKFISHSIFLIN